MVSAGIMPCLSRLLPARKAILGRALLDLFHSDDDEPVHEFAVADRILCVLVNLAVSPTVAVINALVAEFLFFSHDVSFHNMYIPHDVPVGEYARGCIVRDCI